MQKESFRIWSKDEQLDSHGFSPPPLKQEPIKRKVCSSFESASSDDWALLYS
jgi:hypothetical protein